MTNNETKVTINVRDANNTYTATSPGSFGKTSCTAGAATAAFRHAMKLFNLEYEDAENRLTVVQIPYSDGPQQTQFLATLSDN